MAAPAMISSAAQHHQLPPPANLISIATPSRDSMTFTSTKGLLNGPGQNNCFLNSAVQVLWHLDIFRRSFRDLSGHACMAESCIFCALKELFSQLQFSNETALPPDALRRALAESFFDQQRFQLGFMDDAAECFENMLLRIHMHIAHGEAEDMCNARHCIPHQKFAMTLVEQSVCRSCGATSEPLSYTQMVHYVSTSTLVYQARNRSQNNVDPFGQVLRNAGSQGDVRYCPSACGAVIQIGRTLMNRPEIVSVGLVWNSERPTLEHIMEVFSSIGTTLRLSDVFNTVVDSRWAENCVHSLVGVVTYYGKHYSTFFFHTKLRVWIYFDDATVREVGPRWDQVVEKCRKGRYQPLLLLYALPDGTPVNTENAPKQVTPFYADNKLGNKKPPTPQTNNLRRSVTPSPEKPIVGNTRRAITPNPDSTAKPPLPRPYNEYQNLSVIQSNINLYNNRPSAGVDTVDGDLPRKEPEYVTRKLILDGGQKLPNVHRTLSNGSSSGTEMCFRDYLNIPRTRDSGNWSSDRNSASSSSSTTMENPYSYLLGKVSQENGTGVPMPPRNDSSSSNSSGVYDVGYDSYSLSSNDSSTMTTIQHLMKMGHLAKIPEDYNTPPAQISQSCDVLCDEADELLVKSRQLEDEHDLVLALALCNAAATKTRAAMDAPYNNPQTLTLARMKHNTCIMRARSLHRRMTQSQLNQNKDFTPEIRHTREGSSGSGKHSRQNSRDKTQHSRQNSREMLEKPQPTATKSIEIYATLPKKKDGLKKVAVNIEDDPDYVLYDKPPGRETRSIFSRSKNKEANKAREKRSRSEDRNKMSRDFSIAPEIITGKDTLKREKVKEEKEEKKDKDGKSKKQHKIRRKLMGGLIRRKNRSMPDLTDSNVDSEAAVERPSSTVDDSSIGLKDNSANNNMCGYLSEGHLEFSGNSTNPNLERSKLMRKSFHNSAGKILAVAKVPPPPPLRTTSQLSSNAKLNGNEVCEDKIEMQQQNFFQQQQQQQQQQQHQLYAQNGRYPHIVNSNHPDFSNAPISLPYNMNPHYPQIQNPNFNNQYDRRNVTYRAPESNMVVTRADVHQERDQYIPPVDDGVDEVDCMPSRTTSLDLPPYPSPLGSAVHSRQASEEFPPPPPPLDLSALDEHLTKENSPSVTASPGSLLAQLQNKRQEILSQDSESKLNNSAELVKSSSGGDIWLKELQAKQAALRMKKNPGGDTSCNNNTVTAQRLLAGESDSKVVSSVKDLANRFENIQIQPLDVNDNNASVPSMKASETIDKRQALSPEQAREMHQVESTTTTAAIQKILDAPSSADPVSDDQNKKPKLTKKKSVSFCDQVILVATAEDQEDDSYIPNPILERVLRSAMNKPETASIRQELLEKRQAETALLERSSANEHLTSSPKIVEENPYGYHQPLYVRRNSLDNLLTKPEPIVSSAVPSADLEGNYISHSSDPNKQIYGTSPQYNMQQNARQSPYQRIPSNSPVYNAYNNHHAASGNRSPIVPASTSPIVQNPSHQINPQQQTRTHQSPSYIYSQEYNNCASNSAPRTAYAQQIPQIRQSPNPSSQQNLYPNQTYHPVYQHPPSPSPSNVSSNYNYQQAMYGTRPSLTPDNLDSVNRAQYSPSYGQRVATSLEQTPPQQQTNVMNNPYQRPPAPPENIEYSQNYLPSCYQTSPPDNNNAISYPPQRYPADGNSYYQRVPPPHMDHEMMASYHSQNQQQASKYSPYQQVPPPKQMLLKKTVSFEPGTKGGAESPTPKAVVTPIIVNNANNSVPTGKTKCNLCRKKATVSSNLYCMDCEFYMSRFKPKR